VRELRLKVEAIPVAPYFQVKQMLLDHIVRNLAPGDRIPSERILAEQAGLARATLAKAINHLVGEGVLVRMHGKGTFVADTARREDQGYLRYFADNVKLKRAFRICILYYQGANNPEYRFLQSYMLLEAIDRNLKRLGGSSPIAINLYDMKSPVDECMAALLAGGKPDGVILAPDPVRGGEAFGQVVHELQARGIAAVIANQKSSCEGVAGVVCDHAGGIRMMVEYLVQRKHRDIALVARDDQPEWVAERIRSFAEACVANGIPGSAGNVICRPVPGAPNYPQTQEPYLAIGREAGAEIFADLRYSALLGVNDGVAVGLCQAAEKFGIAVPQRCAITGFDDHYLFRDYNLTTLRYPISEIAENVLGILLLRLHRDKTRRIPQVTKVMPELIVRASS